MSDITDKELLENIQMLEGFFDNFKKIFNKKPDDDFQQQDPNYKPTNYKPSNLDIVNTKAYKANQDKLKLDAETKNYIRKSDTHDNIEDVSLSSEKPVDIEGFKDNHDLIAFVNFICNINNIETVKNKKRYVGYCQKV
jgi:hypothetical protein